MLVYRFHGINANINTNKDVGIVQRRAILQYLATAENAASSAVIAAATGIAKVSVHKHMQRLEECKAVTSEEAANRTLIYTIAKKE
jgi:predicted ArsR family transcriptional regulator